MSNSRPPDFDLAATQNPGDPGNFIFKSRETIDSPAGRIKRRRQMDAKT
jgi:hypothetical protein